MWRLVITEVVCLLSIISLHVVGFISYSSCVTKHGLFTSVCQV